MIPNVIVKLVQNDKELADAFFVRHEVFVKEQGIPAPLEKDQYDAESQHIVAYLADEPIAAGRIRIVNTTVAKVDRICVLPTFRRQQIGVRMMQALEEYAFEYTHHHTVEIVKLHAQSHAVPFYETLNYKVMSPEFIDGGLPYRLMEKKLK